MGNIDIVYLVLLILASLNRCSCDVFHAQVELESLFELRKSVTQAVSEYIKLEEMRIELIKQKFLMSGLSRLGESRNSNFPQLSGESESKEGVNPVNSYLTIKALYQDLPDLMSTALDNSNSQAFTEAIETMTETNKFPIKEDLQGAAIALTRLQDTYLLSTEMISEGCLSDSFCSIRLSVEDCFEIGRQSYDVRDYDHAILWFKEALRKLEDDEVRGRNESNFINSMHNLESDKALGEPQKPPSTLGSITKSQVVNYISWAEDIKNTIHIGKQFLSELTGIELDAFIDEVVKSAETQPTEGEADEPYSMVMERYKALCRGQDKGSYSTKSSLKCIYGTRFNNPYFIIGPIKEEQLNLDPPLYVFHDVIYDSEIQVIKDQAIPRFETAQIINSGTGGHEHSTVRVSKSAWLIDQDHEVIAKLNTRIKLLTALDLETGEDLQIANYGIGGMYYPHFDFSHTLATINMLPVEEGNRIATLMFYLTDVKAGGATAFPHLNISIWPEKGSAAFWYNLKPDGRGDYRTQHGACPVLVGNKWVANKWIHERGQEFIRPCNLHPNGPKLRNGRTFSF